MKEIISTGIRITRRLLREIKTAREYFYYSVWYRRPRIPGGISPISFLVCGGQGIDRAGDVFRMLFPQRVRGKMREADTICAHTFDLLGSGPTKLSPEAEGYQPIDWHGDFKAKYRWGPRVFYKKITYGRPKGVDVKIPWELSRCQHLVLLGQAYLLSKDTKYRDEFVHQVTDWIAANPVAVGVNWACTMDVAIRAANWLVALEFFIEAGLPAEFLNQVYRSIYEHGRFIRRNLEYSPVAASNHYIADLAGLFFIAVYCPFIKESPAWKEFCRYELTREIRNQVYEDGCSYEASTSYHRLVLEMCFYCEILGARAGAEFPAPFREKVRKMFDFSLYCVKPNGRVPQIGDNDNGRFLIFSSRPVLEHRYLLCLAATYYRDQEFKVPGSVLDEEAFWMFGEQGQRDFERLSARSGPVPSRAFPDAGWFIIRHDREYCFVSCGPNGLPPRGSHAHNDKLSFELMIQGKDVIVDPGTYVYTPYPEQRNAFRSVKSHNTLQFGDAEQNDIPERDMFFMPETVKIAGAWMEESSERISFTGAIHYAGYSHQRRISFLRSSGVWEIEDTVISSGAMALTLRFNLAPGLAFVNSTVEEITTKEKLAVIDAGESALVSGLYEYSPSYGRKVPATSVTGKRFARGGTERITVRITT